MSEKTPKAPVKQRPSSQAYRSGQQDHVRPASPNSGQNTPQGGDPAKGGGKSERSKK